MSRIVSVVELSCVAVVVCALVAAPAFAQDPPAAEPAASPPPVAQQAAASSAVFDRPGFDFGVRVGYALPFGHTSGDTNLSEGISGAVPLVLEVGYRLNANFTVAALFQYGFAQINSGGPIDCSGTPGIDCSASIMRLGIEAIYNLNLAAPLTPWVGIGTGYEWFSYSVSGGGQSGSVGARGFEFVTLHAGGDYFAAPNFAIGPFLSFSLAQYANVSGEAPGMSIDMEITDKSMHQWLQMGVRGRFGL